MHDDPVPTWLNASTLSPDNASEKAVAAAPTLDTKQLYFIGYGIVPPIIIVFGFAGNLLTLVVLSRPHFRAVSYTYLRWLSASDLLAMLIWMPIIVRDGWKVPVTSIHAARYYALCHLFLHNTFLASSAFLVVALSVERYVSVCHPARAQSLITPLRAKLVVVIIYLVATAIHVPYIFEETWIALNRSDSAGELRLYKFERNPEIYDDDTWAMIYAAYGWIQSTVTKFIPIILVLTLNTWTVTAFYRVVARRQQMVGATESSVSHRRLREQQRIMILLICVAVIFVSCLLPMPFLIFFFNTENLRYYSFHVFRVAANLLETGNSALNFYVYCVASADFRAHLRFTLAESLCCCCPGDLGRARGASGMTSSANNAARNGETTRYEAVPHGETTRYEAVPHGETTRYEAVPHGETTRYEAVPHGETTRYEAVPLSPINNELPPKDDVRF